MSYVIAESYPLHELEHDGITPEDLKTKWMNVAEDMALIQDERNVRVVNDKGVIRVEVSEELFDCMRGGF